MPAVDRESKSMLKRKMSPLDRIGHRLKLHIYSSWAMATNFCQHYAKNAFFEDLKQLL